MSSTLYLHPGYLHISSDPCAITTILGSCVSVCLWDPKFKIGGMNHYLLPQGVSSEKSTRFGDFATPLLLERLISLGCQITNLRAKVFGGACVLEAFKDKADHLGLKNVQVAINFLQSRGIPILENDIGGKKGRKLVFHTNSGDAWIKWL